MLLYTIAGNLQKGEGEMNFEKFTQNAQNAIAESQNIAIQMGHQQLDGEHVHLALLLQEDGLVPRILGLMGIGITGYVRDVEAELDRRPKVAGGDETLYPTRRAGKLLGDAEKIAKKW